LNICKQKALYVKTCIIQNGVPDFHEDVLNATDIKKIFTSFNNQDQFEIYHEEIPIEAVSLLENYISQTDEQIGSTLVPKGSWNAVIRVDNPLIKEKLLNGDFGGVSLNNRVQTSCSTGLAGRIRYSDLRDAECVIPIYISFVEEPANLVGLHIMDYNVYIQKSKSENDGGKRMSLLDDLKALIKKAEEEVEDAETPTAGEAAEEPVEEIEKEATDEKEDEEAVEEEPVAEEEIQKDATADGEKAEATEEEAPEEEPVIEKSEETETETEEVEIQKEAEDIVEEVVEDDAIVFDAEAEINALKEEIAQLKTIVEELLPKNPIDEEIVVEEEPSDEPIITKSAKIEVTEEPSGLSDDFYTRTGRDPLTGKKIRRQSKILN